MREARASLTQQTFSDCDILVFDDGSEDDTRTIIEQAAEKDSRIRLVGSQRVGLVAALNRTIAASDSDLIARIILFAAEAADGSILPAPGQPDCTAVCGRLRS